VTKNYHLSCNSADEPTTVISASPGSQPSFNLTLPSGYEVKRTSSNDCSYAGGNQVNCPDLAIGWYTITWYIAPGTPTCRGYDDFYINQCTPYSNYSPVVQEVCQTNNPNVTVNMDKVRNADQMSVIKVPADWDCKQTATSNFTSYVSYAPSTTRTLTEDFGLRKVCGRFVNSATGKAVQCGAMIELVCKSFEDVKLAYRCPSLLLHRLFSA
jgi:hypothetical protein